MGIHRASTQANAAQNVFSWRHGVIRTWALVGMFVGLVPQLWSARPVSVAELERVLAASQSLPDGELAAQLSNLQLTERLSWAQLTRWRTELAGAKSQRALLGLADRSAFLEPPAGEIPNRAAPDVAEQRRILGLTATYVSNAIPQLPGFYATRTTTHFESAPAAGDETPGSEGSSLHAVRISRTTVQYRDGQEIVEPGPVKVEKTKQREHGLTTWGAFGPVLGLVLVDAAQNKLAWSHWEHGAAGPLAVFRYAVPKDKSHYEVRYCCIAASYGLENTSFQAMSGYHGEMAVDPATGIITRLTVEAELGTNDPISRASIAVEYGPVELGGKTYICPSRSVSISVAKTIRNLQDPSGHSWPTMGPWQTLLNHVDFDQYHLFRAETRVLSGSEERSAGLAPDATLPAAAPAGVAPSEEELADAPPAPPSPASGLAAPAGGAPAAAGGEAQEITTSEATELPEGPARAAVQGSSAAASSLTLHINARLVDVNVVALDKKGRPVSDLKPEDFEVYDNGVKQNVSMFNQANATTTPPAPAPAASPASAGDGQTFSNRAAKEAQSKAVEGNTIILLLDGSNLAWADFAVVREQTMRFLKSVPPNERVALYAMRYHGYQVLEEATADHNLVANRLSKWGPVAQDLANGQDEEQRHRQQIEYVHSPEDMLNVNGNYTLDPTTQGEALDPKLRELGSRPGPIAMTVLTNVAHHLALLPGHKSLVWITSDNVLVDWTRSSITIEKTSKYIEPAALRTQEAMNNAHVSVYPLDASMLEANIIKADIGNRNVQLTPTFQMPLGNEQMMEGPEATAGQDMNTFNQHRDFGHPGRLTAQMEQDMHPIQGVFREVAEATGGRALRRASNISGELDGVVADGNATYLLGFTPSQPADGQYHLLTVKMVGRRDIQLRYRTGYEYDKEPMSLKDRFAQVVWEPVDASDIGVSSKAITDAAGHALRVTVAGSDLDLSQQNTVWTGKLDIFLVQRDATGQHAKVTGKTVGLRLQPATYQHAISDGLTFDERIDSTPVTGSLRVVVVDVNSGHMGSVTVPTAALEAMR
jgi:VWFA-related protein